MTGVALLLAGVILLVLLLVARARRRHPIDRGTTGRVNLRDADSFIRFRDTELTTTTIATRPRTPEEAYTLMQEDHPEALDIVTKDAYEQGMRDALALIREEHEGRALERASAPEGGSLIPSVEPGSTHWNLQPGQVDANGKIVGRHDEIQERIRQLEGWVAEPGVLTVAPERLPGFGLRFAVRDARSGELVDHFASPELAEEFRAEHTSPVGFPSDI